MTVAPVIVFLLVFGATMAYVGWPLVYPLLAEDEPTAREARRHALLEEKERLLQALRDIDHDHRTGKLDDGDYEQLTGKLKRQAADVLKELDVNAGRKVLRPGDAPHAVETVPVVDGPLAKAVSTDAPTIRVTHAELKKQAEAATARFCPKCGRKAKEADDKFCGKCGATLPTD